MKKHVSLLVVALLGLLAVVTTSVAAETKSAAAPYDNGVSCVGKGDLPAAIVAFTEAIRLDPKFAAAYYKRGTAYCNKGEYGKAITDLTDAIRLDPKYAKAYHNRGSAYCNKGEYDKAIADYTEAIRLDPKSSWAYCHRGAAYGNKGEFEKEIADCREAIRLDPKDAQVYCNRGDAFVRKGNLDKAVTVEQEVAETLARLIAAVILPDDDLSKGHELTDVIHDKTGCCQGDALLYFVLGNSIGLSVRGLEVRVAARESLPSGKSHVANLVLLSDGLMMIIADVTRQLGHERWYRKPFDLTTFIAATAVIGNSGTSPIRSVSIGWFSLWTPPA